MIGVPDPKWTQSVKAIVVLAGRRDGHRRRAHRARAARSIASYKKPREIEFVDALPRVGFAVDYDALDARFGGGEYPGTKMQP